MMKKLLVLILVASSLIANVEAVLQSKPVNKLKCWRFGLSRSGANDTKGVPNKNGEKWRTKIGGTILSSPVLYDGIVYIGADKGFFALNANSGKEVWSIPIKNGGVKSSACIADGFVYFNGEDGYLYSVEAKTGKVKWKSAPKGYWGKAVPYSPGVAYGLVFSLGSGGIAGFDVETGKEVYLTSGGIVKTAGVCTDGKYFYGLSAGGTSFQVTTIETGLPYKGFNTPALSYCRATPALANGKAYGTSVALIGTMVAYPKLGVFDTENKKFKAVGAYIEPHKKSQDRKATFASPTIWGGKVYVGCDSGYMYSFDDKTLEPKWNFNVGSPVRASASVSKQDGILYFPAFDGKLYALDAETGTKKWEHKIADPTKNFTEINSCPWVEDGAVYIGTVDGEVVAIH